MELVERYLQAVGRALPPQQQADILTEIRSSLYDELEQHENPDQQTVVKILQTMGPPQKVAAAYYPQNNYLIGPSLYPTFRLVLGIVFSAFISIQILLGMVDIGWGNSGLPFDVWQIFSNLPAAIGMVVIVFWLLQQTDVQVATAKTFDPHKLPPLESAIKPANRPEKVFTIIIQVWVLVFLGYLGRSGVMAEEGSPFANPVLLEYLPWIGFSLSLGIAVELWVLWRGYWHTWSRVAYMSINAFTIVILTLLLTGHNEWLAAKGVSFADGFLWWQSNPMLREPQTAGMAFTRIAIVVAIFIAVAEIIYYAYHLWRSRNQTAAPGNGNLSSYTG